jgi:hypothetical protein
MQLASVNNTRVGIGGIQDSNNTPIQLYRYILHPYAMLSISTVNI